MGVPRPFAISLAEEILGRAKPDEIVEFEVAVMTRLRAALEKVIGVHGFDVVLARASTLARAHDTSPAQVVVVSHLFELLMRFIGEDLTSRIIRDAWTTQHVATGSKETTNE